MGHAFCLSLTCEDHLVVWWLFLARLHAALSRVGCLLDHGILIAQQGLESLPLLKLTQVLHPDLLNENFRRAQYAVRGELYLKGEELRKAGREIIFTNGTVVLIDVITIIVICILRHEKLAWQMRLSWTFCGSGDPVLSA